MTQQERIEHVKAGGTVELDDQDEALELTSAINSNTDAVVTMRKIEEGTWQVMQVPKGGFGGSR